MSRSKYWCFTLNNYNDNDELLLQQYGLDGIFSYLVYGKEIGDSGTEHLQGYFELPNRLRFNQVKALHHGLHLEQREGSAEEARDYCMKDNDFIEIGIMTGSSPGARSDIMALKASLDDGKSLSEVSDEHFREFLKYERGIRSYILLHSTPRNWVTEVHVRWGDTGTGKTRYVWDNHPHESIYCHPGGQWFDGYGNHEVVLFDDFSGSCFALPYLLKLCDRYPMTVPVKGGFVNWAPRKIFITSNLNPEEWYSRAHEEHVAALRRRFTTITHFDARFNIQ